jgi:hypothetical protein
MPGGDQESAFGHDGDDGYRPFADVPPDGNVPHWGGSRVGMTKRAAALALMSVAVAGIIALSVAEASYLNRGYSIEVAFGGAGSTSHVTFPLWRQAIHLAIGVGAIATVGLCYVRRRAAAVAVGWASFLLVLVVGTYDEVSYGTIASPTSIWAVGLFLILAVMASLRVTFGFTPDEGQAPPV